MSACGTGGGAPATVSLRQPLASRKEVRATPRARAPLAERLAHSRSQGAQQFGDENHGKPDANADGDAPAATRPPRLVKPPHHLYANCGQRPLYLPPCGASAKAIGHLDASDARAGVADAGIAANVEFGAKRALHRPPYALEAGADRTGGHD